MRKPVFAAYIMVEFASYAKVQKVRTVAYFALARRSNPKTLIVRFVLHPEVSTICRSNGVKVGYHLKRW
jgi:hypothetical protein